MKTQKVRSDSHVQDDRILQNSKTLKRASIFKDLKISCKNVSILNDFSRHREFCREKFKTYLIFLRFLGKKFGNDVNCSKFDPS